MAGKDARLKQSMLSWYGLTRKMTLKKGLIMLKKINSPHLDCIEPVKLEQTWISLLMLNFLGFCEGRFGMVFSYYNNVEEIFKHYALLSA